ncbi:MAG: RNA polymerase sigma factor [Bacteroidota bacterium]
MTDEQLMQAVQQGKQKALGTLFERYQQCLFSYFMRMTWDRPLSEDLTQETFERIWKYRSSFQASRVFKAWLYQIARNVCVKHLNRSKRMPMQTLDTWQNYGTEKTIQDNWQDTEQVQQLNQALSRLSHDHREVLLLTRYTGMKYAEAAEALGCSVSAVKVRVFRATEQLRKQFFKLENR